MRDCRFVWLVLGLVVWVSGGCCATDTWQTLMPGVTYLHRTTTSPYHWSIHVVKVDLTNPRVRIKVVKKQDSNLDDCGETTSSMARRHGALAAINTDFFMTTSPPVVDSHQPQGYCVTDGIVTRTTPLVSGRATVQFSAGNGLTALNAPASVQSWWYNCTAGGPIILQNGVIGVVSGTGPYSTARDPYTACALSSDGKTLIMLAEDGRVSGVYDGMTPTEIATVLVEMGGYQGMLFDGGGSTTMAINGSVINHPSDGSERKVAAALMVLDTQATPNPAITSYQTQFESPTFAPGDVSGVGGWSRDGAGTAAISNSSARSGSQALRISGAGASHSVGSMGYQPVAWVDCWVMPTSTTGQSTIYANSAGGTCSAIRFDSDGKIKYQHLYYLVGTNTWTSYGLSTSSYSANTWYRITLREDFHPRTCFTDSSPNGGYSLYINGQFQKLYEGPAEGFCTAGASTTLNQVRFEHSGDGAMVVDDLCVSNIEPRHGWTGAGQARSLPDGSTVDIGGAIVASSFSDAYYAESPDRTGAIKLISSVAPAAGSKISASGRVATVGGEKVLQCNYLKVLDTGQSIPKPLRPSLRDLWLMRPDNLSAGCGLPLSGMSVRVDGKIIRVESDRFYIDDGGAAGGLPVLYSGMAIANQGRHAVVDGFVTSYLEPTGYVTAVRALTTGGVRLL